MENKSLENTSANRKKKKREREREKRERESGAIAWRDDRRQKTEREREREKGKEEREGENIFLPSFFSVFFFSFAKSCGDLKRERERAKRGSGEEKT